MKREIHLLVSLTINSDDSFLAIKTAQKLACAISDHSEEIMPGIGCIEVRATNEDPILMVPNVRGESFKQEEPQEVDFGPKIGDHVRIIAGSHKGKVGIITELPDPYFYTVKLQTWGSNRKYLTLFEYEFDTPEFIATNCVMHKS